MFRKNRTKNNYLKLATLLIATLSTAALFFGCGDALGEEISPKITPEYLSTEYVQQLQNDGAEQLLGSLELSQNDSGEIEIILHPKELVQDDSTESGFRVDSFALNRTLILPEQAYITFLPGDESEEPDILTPAEFLQIVTDEHKAHGSDFAAYGDHKLYDVYVLDTQALLVLAHYIP